MKAVMISIQPKLCELIASGKKTIEVRKTRPKIGTPFKCYIYATWNGSKKEILVKQDGLLYCEDWRKANGLQRANGKVIGEFVCDYILHSNKYAFIGDKPLTQSILKLSCLSIEDINQYRQGKNIYAWHISDLVIYDKPRELGEFNKIGATCFYNEKGVCWDRNQNDVIHCENLDCDYKKLTTPPKSWQYVEEKENEKWNIRD